MTNTPTPAGCLSMLNDDTKFPLVSVIQFVPGRSIPREGRRYPDTHQGILWNLNFYPRLQSFDIPRLWRDLSPLTRQVLVHLLLPNIGEASATFPAIDNTDIEAYSGQCY